ncbi:Nuclear receptor 2C2-associated protein [Hypsizygus marmoreus]|uniref:Nuclear receptor 2C2-associated protein n=1 Tax=Hypsizygus marmoreus TaxID=39966 RepID=A0A369JFF5_HYPMA|nr:Nuclear receptor 2C2-associated protein [Hypsizygus marmoreus]
MSAESISLIAPDTSIKVSTTLDKSVGKKYLTDGSPETCWTSQQGLPQHIQLVFAERVIPKRIALTFQGGFVGTQCSIFYESDTTGRKEWQPLTTLYPEDVNRRQVFDIPPPNLDSIGDGVRSLKLVFEQSSDFFGRITVYDLQIEGTMAG